jgi:hypothetical protein
MHCCKFRWRIIILCSVRPRYSAYNAEAVTVPWFEFETALPSPGSMDDIYQGENMFLKQLLDQAEG